MCQRAVLLAGYAPRGLFFVTNGARNRANHARDAAGDLAHFPDGKYLCAVAICWINFLRLLDAAMRQIKEYRDPAGCQRQGDEDDEDKPEQNCELAGAFNGLV